MNHIQFIPVSATEAEIINRSGVATLDNVHSTWWRAAELRTFGGKTGPNEASFPDGLVGRLLLTSLGLETNETTYMVMTVQHLAMAASRFSLAHIQSRPFVGKGEEHTFDTIAEAMSEAVCAAHVHYCTHVLITIN